MVIILDVEFLKIKLKKIKKKQLFKKKINIKNRNRFLYLLTTKGVGFMSRNK
jgi:hypothetical protein